MLTLANITTTTTPAKSRDTLATRLNFQDVAASPAAAEGRKPASLDTAAKAEQEQLQVMLHVLKCILVPFDLQENYYYE